MSRLFEALRKSADGAFVVDDELRVVYWNKAAEAALGFNKEEVVGQFCYELLRGYNDGRKLVCKARCKVAELIMKSEPVPNYDVRMTTKHGVSRWLNMSIFTYRTVDTEGRKMIVHFFHNVNHKTVGEKLLDRLVEVIDHYRDFLLENETDAGSSQEVLTPREREVLILLAKGYGTKEISKLLSISPNTVRNHIQHIFQKLQVHTRLEAVARAIKNDLISY